jgi:CheY-like chemotaxis protein
LNTAPQGGTFFVNQPGQPLCILLVDDDPKDAFLVRHALEECGLEECLSTVGSAEEAIHYLKGEAGFDDRQHFPFPNVILTDLKMPFMGGLDLLRWVRSQKEFTFVPMIVLSNSKQEGDVQLAYQLGANAYMVKPTDLQHLAKLLRLTYEYWLNCERACELTRFSKAA